VDPKERKRLAKEHGLTPAQLDTTGVPVNGGFRIDYYHPRTRKKTDMYRVRLSGVSGSGKYKQPGGTLPEAYYSRLADWKRVFALLETDDAKPRLLITEGEFKAAKACAEGFPCIGLGGAFNFASRPKDVEWLPTLEYFSWKDLPVYIAFDSDATAPDKNVQLAETRLALRLSERGALVHILRLPKLPNGTKCGLDDYLIEYGPDSLKKLMDEVKAWDKDVPLELHAMNDELVYVEQPNSVVRLADRLVMGTMPFRVDLYGDRMYMEDGKKPVATAKKWMQWPQRRKANGITFAPGGELFVDDLRHPGHQLLNMWSGWGAEPVRGDVTVYHRLMDRVYGHLPEELRQWARQWFAYPLQNPGTKLHTAMILHGPQGTGKSLVAKYHRLLYGNAGADLTQTQLDSAFNDWIKNKCFVEGDEVTTRESRRSVAELLKNWITGHTVPINEKYIPAYTLPNKANFCLTSNHEDALYLEDSDRRFFVVEVETPPMTAEEGAYFGNWIEAQRNRNALLYHLLEEVDCIGFEPGAHAPMTEAKQEMINAGLTDLDAWVRQLPSAPIHPDSTIHRVGPLHTAEELRRMAFGNYPRHSTVSVALAMKRAGFRRAHAAQQVKMGGHLVTLWPTVKGLGPKQLETLIRVRREAEADKERFRRFDVRNTSATGVVLQ
jgi:hypothetical protein